MRISYVRIKSLLGLPHNKRVRFAGESNRADLARLVKKKLIAARRAGNDELAAELSQVKQFFKMPSRYNRCVHPNCGAVTVGLRCQLHHLTRRKEDAPRQISGEARESAQGTEISRNAFDGSSPVPRFQGT